MRVLGGAALEGQDRRVDDVPAAQQAVLDGGGAAVGEVVTVQTDDGRRVTWCYVTDPEGNIVELQAWSDGG